MLEYLANANLALPEDLTAVIAMIHTQAPDAYGIFFDCDGPVVPYLPTYPW